MKAFIVISAVFMSLLAIPVWLYLVYRMLVMIGATEFMWFLYWAYVPLTIITQVFSKLIQNYDD